MNGLVFLILLSGLLLVGCTQSPFASLTDKANSERPVVLPDATSGLNGGTPEIQSRAYWNGTQPFSIKDYKASGYIALLDLQNSGQEAVTLTEINGNGFKTFLTAMEFSPGQREAFAITLNDICSPGAEFSFYNVTFTYDTGSVRNRNFTGRYNLAGICQ